MLFKLYNNSSAFGGQERYAESLTAELEKQSVTVLFEGGPRRLAQLFSSENTDNRPLQADVEILNGNNALYQNGWKKKQGLRLYVQHSHINDGQGRAWKKIIRKVLLWVLLWRVDAIIRVCDAALPDCYGHGRIRTVYNGVKVPSVVASLDCSNGEFRMVMIGAINSNKNQQQAIQVLRCLPSVTLDIVGDGPQQKELMRQAEALGVSERVCWYGFLEDPMPVLRKSHVLLMLSHFEAFPYAVLESMALGVPVVAFPVGGVPEVITHNVNGILIEDRSTASLVACLEQVMEDTNALKELGQAARQTVMDRFTIDHMVDGFLKVVAEAEKLRGRK